MPALQRLDLPPGSPGEQIYRFDLNATIVFVVSAAVAAAFPSAARIPFAVLSCVLFATGTVTFLSAYGQALNRSRTDAISLPGIYGLSRSCPKGVQWRFHALTLAQTVTAITAASIRPFTAQAFGILVPMLGLGLGGLWAARYGVFGERDDPREKARKQVKESFNE